MIGVTPLVLRVENARTETPRDRYSPVGAAAIDDDNLGRHVLQAYLLEQRGQAVRFVEYWDDDRKRGPRFPGVPGVTDGRRARSHWPASIRC